MLASVSRFILDALLLLRFDDGKPCTVTTYGSPLLTEQTSGYWRVSGASIEQFAVNFLVSNINGTVSFAIAASTDPTFASPSTVLLAKTGPVSATGHVMLGMARESIDSALVALGAVTDVSNGGVSAATPVYVTAAALVPNSSAVSWSAYECQLVS